jgi:hypothetical protein
VPAQQPKLLRRRIAVGERLEHWRQLGAPNPALDLGEPLSECPSTPVRRRFTLVWRPKQPGAADTTLRALGSLLLLVVGRRRLKPGSRRARFCKGYAPLSLRRLGAPAPKRLLAVADQLDPHRDPVLHRPRVRSDDIHLHPAKSPTVAIRPSTTTRSARSSTSSRWVRIVSHASASSV